MSGINGVSENNKDQINGINGTKNKNSLIDLSIRKAIYSKKALLKFFKGK